MIESLYYIIIGLFILGAILMAIINHRNPGVNKRKNWIKYITYFFVVNVVLSCAAFYNEGFILISIIIILFGMYEIGKNTLDTQKYRHGIISMAVFMLLSYTLIHFSYLEKEWMLFTVFNIFIFDAFSQITGQLFGKRKITPVISPNKTLEGMIGGFFFGTLSAFLLRNEVNLPVLEAILIGFSICFFAFTGDLLASYCKRKFGVKDFGTILPGHGGILDRFDSLVMTSLFLFLLKIMDYI